MTPELRIFIERNLAGLERAWRDGSDKALGLAVGFCHQHGVPLPGWLAGAVVAQLGTEFTKLPKKIGRHSNPSEAERQNRIHYTRWDAVKELRDRRNELERLGYKPTWEEAYANASEMLDGTEAAGSPEAIKKSYQKVNQLLSVGNGARYFVSGWGN